MRRIKEWFDSRITVRFLKIYSWYIVCAAIAMVICVVMQSSVSTINASFKASEETPDEENQSQNVAVYNYYLDFSPSMQGFFSENSNSPMPAVASVLEQVNMDNSSRFFWCADAVVSVNGDRDFYDSMRTEERVVNYYNRLLGNAGNGTTIEQAIENMDLSNIFSGSSFSKENGNLNVIVTDLNFYRNADDLQGHNEKVERFQRALGNAAADMNICVYAITGNFAGKTDDEYEVPPTEDEGDPSDTGNALPEDTIPSIRNTFFIMILSDEDREYERYCQKFEDAMRSEGLEYAGKFELTDNLTGSNPTLQVESQRYESLGMGEKEFVNYADGAFENLPSNGCALQLVSGEVNDTGEAMFNMPLCELELPGYYMSESTGRNDTEIMIETELYRPNQSVPFAQDQYQAFEDADFQRGDAGMYYADGKWYLSANLRLNVNPDVPNAASWYQRAKELIGREYIVMNLKFYLRRPAFSKPDWIASVVYPWTGNGDENVSDAETVIDGIINSKESAYASKSLKGGYLGNIVMYLLY